MDIKQEKLEQAVLIAIMQKPCLYKLITYIGQIDFINPVNREIYSSIQKQEEPNISLLMKNATNKDVQIRLMELESYFEDFGTHIVKHAEDLRNETMKREFKKTLIDYTSKSNDENCNFTLLSTELKAELESISELTTGAIQSAEERLDKWLHDYYNPKEKRILKTGHKTLDTKFEFEMGNLYIVAAGTGIGKTMFTIDLSNRIIETNKAKCLFYSLEMTADAIDTRMVSNITKLPARKIKKRLLDEKELNQMHLGINKMKESMTLVNDEFGIRIDVMKAQITECVLKGEVDFVVVDQIAIVGAEGFGGDRTRRISHVTEELRNLAGKLGITIIALAQLNRAGEEAVTPELHHIAEAYDIPRFASGVIILSTDRFCEDMEKLYNVALPKSREGQSIVIEMIGDMRTGSFREGNAPW